MAAAAAARGDGTIPPLRQHRTLLSGAALGAAAAVTAGSALRAGAWWPLSAGLGAAGMAWLTRCALRRDASAPLWPGIAGLGAAYTAALLGNVGATDAQAALYAVVLLLAAELAHAATGTPDLGRADRASRVRYSRTLAATLLAGFGLSELLLAAAGSGGSGGAQVTALGVAAAAAALGLLTVAARGSTAR
jgi:hypothetical protein